MKDWEEIRDWSCCVLVSEHNSSNNKTNHDMRGK